MDAGQTIYAKRTAPCGATGDCRDRLLLAAKAAMTIQRAG
jgi:hypothetical protein